MMLANGLLLAAIVAVPGYAFWLAFGGEIRRKVTAAEAVFLMIVTGVTVVSWPAIFLSEVGWFSLPLLLGILGGGSLCLGVWAIKTGRKMNPFHDLKVGWWSLAALALTGLSFLASPRPFEYLVGGRDHGIYVNTGINIARTGSILVHDSDLLSAPTKSRQALVFPEVSLSYILSPGPWSQGLRLPGYTIRDLDNGIVVPHAFHMYPVWSAIFYSVGGLSFALYTTAFFSLLGALAFYFVAARLFGQRVGLLALILLLINVTQVWFTQYPSAEILLRFFIWGGLLAFVNMVESRSRFAAVIAGACLGLLHLTKLDTLPVPLIVFAFFAYLWFTRRLRDYHWFFLTSYLVLSLHAALHAFFISTAYFLDHMVKVILPRFIAEPVIRAAAGYPDPRDILSRLVSQNVGAILVVLVATLLLLWLAVRIRNPVAKKLGSLERASALGRTALAALLGLYVTAAYLAYPLWRLDPLADANTSTTFIAWYLGPAGLLLGLVGIVGVVTGRFKTSAKEALDFTWLFLLGNVLPLMLLGPGTYADHFWAIRRFVPLVLPGFILFATVMLWHLVPRRKEYWFGSVIPLALLAVLIVTSIQKTRPVLGVVDYEGFTEQVSQLSDRLPAEAVILFEQSLEANRLTVPLWFIFERPVFSIRSEARYEPSLLGALDAWHEEGRDVYWVSASKEALPAWSDYVLNYAWTYEFAVPLVERPSGKVPSAVGSYRAPLDLYKLVEKSDTLDWRSAITIDVTSGLQDEGVRSGLYEPEVLAGLTPLRRTSDEVVIDVDIADPPSEILLGMSNGRPPDMPGSDVAVYLNGSLLSTLRVDRDTAIYSIPVPETVPFPAEIAELRLEVSTWVPVQTEQSLDQRELGVYLDWVKLIVTQPLAEPSEKNDPLSS